jgi:hypothetical protein
MNRTMQIAIHAAPAGTSGLVIEPWEPGDTYGVAADWSQASAEVYAYGDDGWTPTGRQVADYRHDPSAALAGWLVDTLRASGDNPGEAVSIAREATEF